MQFPVILLYNKYRSKADYKSAINLFGENDNLEVDASLFNCNNNYIEDYKLEIHNLTQKTIDINLEFNRRNYKNYTHRIIIKDLESGNIVYDKKIKFTNGTDLKCHGKIQNLPNEQLRFEYYMNGILSIEETI